MKNIGLYVHVPFCEKKCDYCDFYSVTGYKNPGRYTDALLLHMEDYSEAMHDYYVDSIYIGGGTPTVLPQKKTAELINGIYDNFYVTEDAEVTMEANPATVVLSDLKKYRKLGVNRLSIGLQSTHDNELAALSRIHNFEEFEESYDLVRRAGFDNINIDIMYGIPEQTHRSFVDTVERVIAMEPEHISMYGLKIEENTPMAQNAKNLNLPTEDVEFAMYSDAINILSESGYAQYEISNFALSGRECKHNLKYWNCEEYLGLGPAAHSYFNGERFSFKRDIATYIETLEREKPEFSIVDERYKIQPQERVGEYIMLRLRLAEGIVLKRFEELFGFRFEKKYAQYIKLYSENDFMKVTPGSISLTVKGMFISNYILSTMLDFEGSEIVKNIADGLEK